MLTAIFADIHGNREALEACLAHARKSAAERSVFLGDYVGYGADPGWVVDTVGEYLRHGTVAILGNHDAAVLTEDPWMNDVARAAIAWTRTQLDAAQRGFLEALPLTAESEDRLFVHASAATPAAWEYVLGPAQALRSLRATRCRLTFCGHVHAPALYQLRDGKLAGSTPAAGVATTLSPDRRWLAVIGAVGQPRDGNPQACYALLDENRDVLAYVRVPYDIETAARKILDAGLPPFLAKRLRRGV